MPTQERVTIKNVAAEAGVSFSLASQVLRGDPTTTRRESTRQRIFAAAKNLNYQHHAGARSLRTGKSHTIGVLSRTATVVTTAIETEHLIIDAIRSRGYHVSVVGLGVHDIENIADDVESVFENMASSRVEGVIINRIVVSECESQLAKLKRAGIPIVAIGSGVDDTVDGFREDDWHGIFEVTSHLTKLGHRQIMYLGYLHGTYVGFPLRLQGYKEAMAAARLPVTEDLLVDLGRFKRQNHCAMGFEAAEWALAHRERPQAIVCCNDEVALGAMAAIHGQGLRVPHDIAIVGYDGIVISRYGAVPLTTVAQPIHELADGATDLLFQRINGEVDNPDPQFRLLTPRLIVRESCGAYLRRLDG